MTSFGNYPSLASPMRPQALGDQAMLADGIDPIETKPQAKAEAVIKGRTFERVALDGIRKCRPMGPGHSKTVMRPPQKPRIPADRRTRHC